MKRLLHFIVFWWPVWFAIIIIFTLSIIYR